MTNKLTIRAAGLGLALVTAASGLLLGTAGVTRADEPTGDRVLSDVHTDAISPYLDNGVLVLASKADVDGKLHMRLDPNHTTFHINDLAIVDKPGPNVKGYEFLASYPAKFYMAPQAQIYGSLWPGFSTEDPALSAALGDKTMSISLKSVEGPGRLEVFQAGLTGSIRRFSSVDKLPAWEFTARQHSHTNWAFEKPGHYKLVFAADGLGQHAEQTYRFVVGPLDNPAPEPSNNPSTAAPSTDPSTAPSTTPSDQPSAPSAEQSKPGSSDPATGTSAPQPSQPTNQPAKPNPVKKPVTGQCMPQLVLDHGHIDAFNISATKDAAVMQLKEDVTGSHVLHQPESVLLRVKESALSNIPADYPGAPKGYVLPLSQRADLIWPGWDTNGVAQSGFTKVRINITAVDGPGSVFIYTFGSFGKVSPILAGGKYQMPGTIDMPQPAHVHAQWVFSNTGIYRLQVNAVATNAAGKQLQTATHQFVFQVGNADLGDIFCKVVPSAQNAALANRVQAQVAQLNRAAAASASPSASATAMATPGANRFNQRANGSLVAGESMMADQLGATGIDPMLLGAAFGIFFCGALTLIIGGTIYFVRKAKAAS